MKGLIIVAILFFCLSVGYSQTKRDSLTEIIVDEMCLNMDSLPIDPFFKGHFTMQFTEVLITILDRHSLEIKDIFGIEDMTEDSAMFLKHNVILTLLQECSTLQRLVKKNKDDVERNIKYWRAEMTYSTTVYTKLKKNIYGEICFIEVGRDDNQIEKIYWLNSFNGCNELANNPDMFMNKWIHLKYGQNRKYNYLTKKYDKINVITSIELSDKN